MALGIALLLIGAIVAGGSFVFAAINVVSGAQSVFTTLSSSNDPFGEQSGKQLLRQGMSIVTRHIGAAVGMGLGGLTAFVGVVLTIVAALSR